MSDMPCPRRMTPGDGRVTRQGTSLLYIAGEKTKASAPWGHIKSPAETPDFLCEAVANPGTGRGE